jgi:hypothetical protein
MEPKPYRPDGVRLWFGSSTLHDRVLARLVRWGHGWNPLGRPTDDDLQRLDGALGQAGRDRSELELVGGTRGRFPDADSTADLDEALATIPEQLERGFTSICIKPSQFLDDPTRHANWCRDVVTKVAALTA